MNINKALIEKFLIYCLCGWQFGSAALMHVLTDMFKVQMKLRRYINAVVYQETTICKCISEDAFEGSIVKDKHVTSSKVLHFMITTIQVEPSSKM